MSEAIPASLPAETERPSHVRLVVVGLAMLSAILLYLDRFCLSFTERYIKEDLGLSDDETSWLLSAFFWTYALGQVPSGWLSDRFGARRMLALYILFWSLFTGLMGLAGTFLLLVLLRGGVGLAQAGAYPTSANLLSRWVPLSSRGLASALVSTGGRIGGFAAPVLTAYLMVAFVPWQTPSLLSAGDLLDPPGLMEELRQKRAAAPRLHAAVQATLAESPPAEPEQLAAALNAVLQRPDLYDLVELDQFALPLEAERLAQVPVPELTPGQIARRNRLLLEAAYPEHIRKVYGLGWRPVMLVYGLAGVLVAGLFWLLVRDRPGVHPLCNAAEERLIAAGLPATNTHAPVRGLPLGAILQNRSLWFSSLSQFGTNFGWVFIVLLLPRYLMEVHRVPIQERGWMASLPISIGMIGMLLGGWLTDRLTRSLGLRWGRRLPMASTRFTAMLGFVGCILLDAPWPVTFSLCVVAVSTDLGTASIWAFMQDIGGRFVGSALGFGNMWGNVGAAVSPLALGLVIQHLGWDAAFAACAAAFGLSGLAALGVDATETLSIPNDG
jgi:sugar phosphate permease